MNWNDLLAAFGIYLILEGLLPFANPMAWRQGLVLISRLRNGQLRFLGLVAVASGLLLVWLVRG